MATQEFVASTASGARATDGGGPIDDRFGSGVRSIPVRRRAFTIYAAIALLGILPSVLGWSPGLQAAGLGLVLPGGGFLAVGGWSYLLLPVTLILMLVAFALWILSANVMAPFIVWAGSALLAANMVGPSAQPSGPFWAAGLVALFFVYRSYTERRTKRRELERRAVRNAYLPRAERLVLARAVPAPEPGSRELSEADLSHLRYALDRGLQPMDSFDGFDEIEQWQTSSLRYQLDYLLWALQAVQCHYAPNFHGYLSQAQRNLIDKFTSPRTWRFYWMYESFFGNFSLNFDPIAKDNIMFGGFFSANLLLYTANTGDRRYMKPGALPFRLNRFKTYDHNVETVLEAGRRNHREALYGPLYPCEPTLTYSACNLWGNFAHLISDRALGTQTMKTLLEPLRELSISEMICRDGTVHSGRMNLLGIRLPVYTCNFVSALWSWMSNAFFPELSIRTWAILREETVSFDSSGDITVATEDYDRIDIGNYKKGDLGVYGQYLILSHEHGDEQVADALMRKIDRDYGRVERGGVTSYSASNYANAVVLLGRFVRRGDIRRMILEGPPESAMQGPLLTEARYPDVLVAKAFSPDGIGIDLVLYPGAGETCQRIRIERLRPGALYRLSTEAGQRDIAIGADGVADLDIELKGRTKLRLALAA